MTEKLKTALLVIDVQNSFYHRPYWEAPDVEAFQENLSKLITGCTDQVIPTAYILHEEESGPFSPESGFVQLMDFLPKEDSAPIFRKQVHSAFSIPQLQAWLQERGIEKLIISGIRSEQCCETTTRAGSDLGYQVDYVTEATLTFPITHVRSGRTYSAAEIKERTELVLEGRFAEIKTVEQCLAAS